MKTRTERACGVRSKSGLVLSDARTLTEHDATISIPHVYNFGKLGTRVREVDFEYAWITALDVLMLATALAKPWSMLNTFFLVFSGNAIFHLSAMVEQTIRDFYSRSTNRQALLSPDMIKAPLTAADEANLTFSGESCCRQQAERRDPASKSASRGVEGMKFSIKGMYVYIYTHPCCFHVGWSLLSIPLSLSLSLSGSLRTGCPCQPTLAGAPLLHLPRQAAGKTGQELKQTKTRVMLNVPLQRSPQHTWLWIVLQVLS